MTIEESRGSQRPYRYGMVLLCIGAVINWLGLAEHYNEPVRYVGVTCIVAGALLICVAMCCWLHTPPTRTSSHTQRSSHPITAQIDDPIHVISVDDTSTGSRQKPPDYEAVADAPPSYDDAIKLNPGQLAWSGHHNHYPHHLHRHRGSIGPVSAPIEHTQLPGSVIVVPVHGRGEPTNMSPPPPYAR
ncbi:hypothetical protein QAD02_015851 [Eretmocerus hayati]|uniref:Uncharacterized protein n=1 Tax=Eretmocerus hayati TaxID=131215 RepID=A0ACC2P8Y7_9HYME|nr:hypothetical protein QAD02_015851 [Eretmocerus hayati]